MQAGEALDTATVDTEAIGLDNLGAFFDRLFDRLDATPDDRLQQMRFSIGGVAFQLRCSREGILERYRGRLISGGEPTGERARIDIVAAADMGWPAGRWTESEPRAHLFLKAAERSGYEMAPPDFDRQWFVRQRRTGNIVHFLGAMEELKPWDSGSPVRVPLQWALMKPQRRLVHAGSLGVDGHGVLVAGPGGAGKSGTTLAGLAGGLRTVGDDYLLLDQREHPVVLPLYRLLKQDTAGIARIPGLAERIGALSPNWQGKFEFDPEAVFPGCMAEGLRIGAILLPVIARQARSTLEPVAPMNTVRYLVDALLDRFAGQSGDDFLFLMRLATRVPIYRLHLSEDPAEIASTVRRVIGDHAR